MAYMQARQQTVLVRMLRLCREGCGFNSQLSYAFSDVTGQAISPFGVSVSSSIDEDDDGIISQGCCEV